MSAAKHTPAGDASFRSSLLRSAVGAVGLVVLVSAAFWAIGTVGGDRGTPVATDAGPEVTAPADDPAEDAEDAEGEGDAGDDGAPDAGEGDAVEGDPDAGEDAAGDDGGDGDPDAGEGAPDAAEGDAGEDDGSSEVERSVAPGEVTIQVLDGFKEDGGTAADRVAALLGDAGYDVIARNDALSYDVTTVLYNPGNEAAAQQVAAELGGAEVREQPGNLSSAVALHVVVGRDRG